MTHSIASSSLSAAENTPACSGAALMQVVALVESFNAPAVERLVMIKAIQEAWEIAAREKIQKMRTVRELVVQIQQARDAAETDDLTGIKNRKYFEERLGGIVWSKARDLFKGVDSGKHYVALMIDLAGLKAINDMIAPVAGDAAIQSLAECIDMFRRKDDVAARIGGDEFAMIIGYGDEENPHNALQRLKDATSKATFEYGGYIYPLSTYISFTQIDGTKLPEDVLDEVGRNLNAQKAAVKHDRTKVDLTPIAA